MILDSPGFKFTRDASHITRAIPTHHALDANLNTPEVARRGRGLGHNDQNGIERVIILKRRLRHGRGDYQEAGTGR